MASLTMAPLLAAQTITDPTAPAPAAPAPAAKPTQGPPSPFTFTAANTADFLDDFAAGTHRGGGYVHLIEAFRGL